MDRSLQFGEQPARSTAPCVGVFDSGVGGLSVLRALHDRMPGVPLLYVGDSAHAPYGERSEQYVMDRSRRIVAHLLQQGAAGVVVACNTATAVAVRELRGEWPSVPIIGVEPGLKPALAATRNRRIGVMATPATLASAKFRTLIEAHASGATVLARPCPGLASLIEGGDLGAPALLDAIEQHAAALRAERIDTVVLGCTHYAFVSDLVQAAMGPEVHIVDTADAVARHSAERLRSLHSAGDAPMPRLQTTGNAERLRAIACAWLPFACEVEGMVETVPPIA
jgi:glutamate racemase